MDFPRYLDHIRNDGDLVAAIAPRGLDLPIPLCPGWDVREVVAHLADVYDHKVMAIRLGRRPVQGEWVIDEPFPKGTVEWFEDEHAKLLAELAAHELSDPAWSWWEPDQTVGFWYRRMALETVVHRVLVESSAHASPDAELSGDPGELFLYLWGRASLDTLTRTGDASRIALMRARLAAATQ